MRSKLTKEIAAAKEEFEAMLVETEQAGLVDEPKHNNKLKLETSQDKIYVLQYLYYRRWHNMSQQEFGRRFPVEYARLREIMPRKQPEEG